MTAWEDCIKACREAQAAAEEAERRADEVYRLACEITDRVQLLRQQFEEARGAADAPMHGMAEVPLN